MYSSFCILAIERAQETAIVAPGRLPLSFRQLFAQIEYVRGQLHRWGIGRQDRVAIVLPNGAEMATAFLGVIATGTAAPLNPAYRSQEFAFYFDDLKAKAVIVQRGMGDEAREVALRLGLPVITLVPNPQAEAGIFSLESDLPEVSVSSMDQGVQPMDVALVLHTSGTTSRPKLVPLTQTNLQVSAQHIADWLQLTAQDRCLNVMPLFHIHGLIGCLLASLVRGGSVCCSPGFQAAAFFDWLVEWQPTWYSAVPTIHQQILARAELNRSKLTNLRLRFVRSSSASLPEPVMAGLEALFGVPVIEAYGMTEATHQMASNPLPPQSRKPGSVGLAAGPAVAIMDNEGNLLAPYTVGEIVIQGANVTEGYASNPTANRSAFTNGWFRTGDEGHLDGEGYLFLRGRIKEIINRGGEKISPREVDDVLLTHAAVLQAVTFAVNDPQLGEEVAAAVVLRPQCTATAEELQAFAANKLAPFKVPRQVVFCAEIPKGPTGKLQRIGLAEKLGIKATPTRVKAAYVSPRTPLEASLAAIWAQVLGVERVGIEDDFLSLGGNSLSVTQVIAQVRERLNLELSFLAFFGNPTVVALALHLETAKPQCRGSMVRGERPTVIPLAFAQKRMWLLHEFTGKTATYTMPMALRLKGSLDAVALRRSFEAIVQRHEALRTLFEIVDGVPVQTIVPSRPPTWNQIDDVLQPESLGALLAAEAHYAFDLANEPLLRVTLVKQGTAEHLLILVMHHIVSDGWSQTILLRELAHFYRAFADHLPPQLPALALQYAEFSCWQQQQDFHPALTYWQKRLNGAPPLLPLPTDHPRPERQSFRGGKLPITLNAALTKQLKDLSVSQKTTLFMTVLAAFQVLLYRYSGQSDLVVGFPSANRGDQQLDPLIGCFVNSLVLRTDLAGNPSFSQLLGQVRQGCLEAYEHQELPFDYLIEVLKPERSLSYNPLFQVMFSLQPSPSKGLEIPGINIAPIFVPQNVGRLDLSLELEEGEDDLQGFLEYNGDLFDAETISRIIVHFQTLLQGIVNNPDQRLLELPILSETERHQLLVEWNDTQAEYPKDACIHQLFEAQVTQTPDAIAIVFEDQRLSYRELNHRANQLAHYLQKMGVEPETLVGICLERSPLILVALLGVLKAGGAYVPLDPQYPKERLESMLADAQVSLLLTQSMLFEVLPQDRQHLVDLETDDLYAQEDSENPTSKAKPTNLAYVLYTSGSTGKPKGVTIEHRSVVAFLNWARSVFTAEQLAGVLAATSLCFDLSVFELLAPLSCGGKVILAKNIFHLPNLPAAQEVTLLNTVPSVIAELLRAKGIPSSVETVLLAGEPLPQKVVDRLYQKSTIQKVFNLYGPSEDTVYSTYALVKQKSQKVPPIGRPIANTQTYILDVNLQPVPIGVLGELYLGGAGLARGYFNQPALTGDQFLPNPFDHELGARLYRTGDLARYLPDGNLEFLGRIDQQVKIRGFRIELGEIEAVLSQFPNVQQAAVIAKEVTPGDLQLVAYFVSISGKKSTDDELRNFFKQKLPEYMVPAFFVALTALPLTPNGKLDRKALSAQEQEQRCFTERSIPRTPVEALLATIWKDVLGLKQVGIQDNFFEVGGHSLKAMQVIARLRSAFAIELPIGCFFQFPTIAELSKYIEPLRSQSHDSFAAIAIEPVSRKQEIPLSFAQQRLWFFSQLMPDLPLYNIPLAYRLKGQLNVEVLELSFREIVRRHESLRTIFKVIDRKVFQAIVPEIDFRLPIVNLQGIVAAQQEVEVERLTTQAAYQLFDFTEGPLFSIKLLHLNKTEYVLLLTVHHIISDGWSLNVFFQELEALYIAFSKGQPSPLPPLPLQYADFVHWQHNWLQGEVLQTQLRYWKQRLGSNLPTLQLPTDFLRPAVQTYRGAVQSLELSFDLCEALKHLSQKEGVTLFMMLLSAFKILLCRYTGQEDITVGTPVAGRNQVETEGLMGLFINTLTIRTNLSGNPSFRQFLSQVRLVTLEAYDHQDLPFEKLIETLNPERDMSRSLLFQTMFTFESILTQCLVLPGITSTPLDAHNGTAKVDLTLNLQETSEGIKGKIEYSTDLFEAATIARMIGHFQTLLEGIVRNPDQRLLDLPILIRTERHQLLVERNDTQAEYPKDTCIHQLFEAQVTQTPDAVAVVFEAQTLSYQDLNRQANRLARHLQHLGVKPGEFVGIEAERSPALVVGLLAILKVGGAYVPIDPSYPAERITLMLRNAKVQILLTQSHPPYLLDNPEIVVCNVNGEQPIHDLADDQNLSTANTALDPAYLLYTSGSTGQPKGVVVPHRAVNRLVLQTNYVALSAADRIAHVSNPAFDAATFEIWGALLNGAQLIIISRDVLLSPNDFALALQHHQVNTLFLTTAYFHELTRCIPKAFSRLRYLLFGGERADPKSVQVILQHGAPQHLLHVYGPTESTTFATCFAIQGDLEGTANLPIGRPIANTTVFVLDGDFQPVPVGVQGELYIGGDGLALGYHNDPERTAEQFLSNPFSEEPGARLYRTGDLARYLPEGNLEFLGRIDQQVKMRGFRIEIAEVEAALSRNPHVQQAVVILQEDSPENKRLLAYIVADREPALTTKELRTFLRQSLPDYMVPSAFIFLDALPLTPNGKLNRRALLLLSSVEDCPTPVQPQGELEQQLTQVWEATLAVHPIARQDNFFDLGGHSLLAVSLLGEIEHQLGYKLPLASLFQAQTIEQQARLIQEQASKKASYPSLVPIQIGSTHLPPLFYVHPLGGNVLCYRDLAECLGKEQSIYGLQALGLDGVHHPLTQVAEIATHYLKEIQTVQNQGPYFLGGFSFGGLVAFEMAQQLRQQGEAVALLALFDSYVPGSQKPIPNVARWKKEWSFWQQKIQTHSRNLLLLKVQDRTAYLRERVVVIPNLLSMANRSIRSALQDLLKQRPQASAESIALPDEISQIQAANALAYKAYQPKPYPGKIILFQSERLPSGYTYAPANGWLPLALGELEIYKIPTDHNTLMVQPWVAMVSKQLRITLAQSLDAISNKNHPGDNQLPK